MSDQAMQFQAEVARLLHIVTHSLYSQKEIFLRELISNASDACDKLRYAAQTDPGLMQGDADLKVTITPDKDGQTLTVADNGIGMDRQELIDNLGTIARSGTGLFAKELTGDAAKDVSLIGQFGVGFYSAFMVADRVTVISRKAGSSEAHRWTSDGAGSFTIGEAERDVRGTEIVLHLRDDAKEYLEPQRLKTIVKTWSEHVPLPIQLIEGGKAETVNTASALWTRPKGEITEQQYTEFYRHVARAFDDPWLTLHNRVEGKLDYTMLLFVPGEKPFDLFDPERRAKLKLYVRRVFISDEVADLVPPWLRFMRGIVDSADLPLNVSREMLQNNPVVARIRQAIQRRVLTELEKKAEAAPEEYAKFWANFGAVLKEGIYEESEHRAKLMKLARFASTHGDGVVSLDDYIGRMKEGQTAIYTISGDNTDALRKSPQLEGFGAKGVEVLLLTDAVDGFWPGVVPDYEGKTFSSVTRGGADLSAIKGGENQKKDESPAVSGAELGTLVALLKQTLGDAVKDVRETDRLTDSAVCLVAAEGDIDLHLARMLKAHQRLDRDSPRILEINPRHPLIRKLAERAQAPGAATDLADAALVLLDQARIIEGEPVSDPMAFTRRLAGLMEKAI